MLIKVCLKSKWQLKICTHRRRKRGARGARPPNNLRGGANIPFGPSNNPPTCTGKTVPLNSILEFSNIISYFKMRNVIIWHCFIKNLMGTRRRYDVMCLLGISPPPFAPPPPTKNLNFGPPNILNLPTPMVLDVYFFQVNTTYSSLNVLKISVISRVHSTTEIVDIFNRRLNIFGSCRKKRVNFLFIFSVKGKH